MTDGKATQPNDSPSKKDAADRGAGVRVPPPLIQLSFLAFGGVLEWTFTSNPVPEELVAPLRLFAFLLIAAGVALASSAIFRFKRAHTHLEPWKPTSAIVTTGPYRFTRNPIYVSFQLIHVGIGLAVPGLWMAATALPAALVIRYYVIAREERYLEQTFGETYLQFKQRVRRWL